MAKYIIFFNRNIKRIQKEILFLLLSDLHIDIYYVFIKIRISRKKINNIIPLRLKTIKTEHHEHFFFIPFKTNLIIQFNQLYLIPTFFYSIPNLNIMYFEKLYFL